MAQILVPVADVAAGAWTATPLWAKVDDNSVLNPTGDGLEITSADNSSPDNADLQLSAGGDPGVSTGHIMRARWRKSASGGHSINAVLELWEGVPGTGTLRATLTVTGIGSTEVQSTKTLTAGEADAIGNYGDLYLRVSRQGDTGGSPSSRRSLVVDLVEFEAPDAAPPDYPFAWPTTKPMAEWGVGFVGPVQATNGDLYCVTETSSGTPDAELWKSTDGGKSYSSVASRSNVLRDLEAAWIVKVPGRTGEWMLCIQRSSGSDVRTQRFGDSTHASFSDDFDAVGNVYAFNGVSGANPDEGDHGNTVSVAQWNSTQLAACFEVGVGSASDGIKGNTWSPGTNTWGTVFNVAVAAGTKDYTGGHTIAGAANGVWFVYKDHTAHTILAKSYSSGGTLGAAVQVNTNGVTVKNAISSPVCGIHYYDDVGVEVIQVVWLDNSDKLWLNEIRDGVAGATPVQVATRSVLSDYLPAATTESPSAYAAGDGSTLWVVYADATSRDLYVAKSENGGAFTGEEQIFGNLDINQVNARKIDIGGAPYLGIMYVSGTTGPPTPIFFDVHALAAGAVVSLQGSAEAAQDVAAALSRLRPIAGSADGAAEAGGDVDPVRGVGGIAEAAVEAAGNVDPTREVGGIAEAVVEAAGAVSATLAIAGSSDAAVEAAGVVEAARGISGTAEAAAESAGAVGRLRTLVGAGEVAAAADGTVTTIVRMDGTAEVAAAADGTASRVRGIGGDAAVAVLAAGDVLRGRGIGGAGDAAGGAEGQLSALLAVAGSAEVAAAGAGDLERRRALTAVAEIAAEATGETERRRGIGGAGDAAADGTGIVTTNIKLDGIAELAASGGGELARRVGIVAAAEAAVAGAGVVSRLRTVSGAAEAAADLETAIGRLRTLAGDGQIAAAGDGTVGVVVGLSGPAVAAATGTAAVGRLRGVGAVAEIAAEAAGIVGRLRTLAGDAAAAAEAAGTVGRRRTIAGTAEAAAEWAATMTAIRGVVAFAIIANAATGTVTVTATPPSFFWIRDPADTTPAPVAYTLVPVVFTRRTEG